jgi:hypothetical protein
MALTKELAIDVEGKPIVVHFLTGLSKEIIPHVRALMRGVPSKYAGLSGVNNTNDGLQAE